jgi:hypothetical protein
MEINSEVHNEDDGECRSHFTITNVNFTWNTKQRVYLIDACFDLNHRISTGIKEPVYYISVSAAERKIFEMRVPITSIYENKDFSVSTSPLYDCTIGAGEALDVKLLGAKGNIITDPGPWSVLIGVK